MKECTWFGARKTPPVAGGMLEQSPRFIDAFEIFESELAIAREILATLKAQQEES